MKISNWSLVGYIIGTILIAAAVIRYTIIWSDNSQAFQFISIGILICAVSWLYNKQLKMSNTLLAVEDYLSELNKSRR